MPEIDLNCDLGEGYGAWTLGDDAALLGLVSSANIACGFHAGDPRTMTRTVAAAAERGVAVGAQVSYPDLVGFGRRAMDVAPEDLTADVLYQLGALAGIARASGTAVRYVKAHGALYHRVAADPRQAAAVVEAVRRYDAGLPLLTLPGSVAAEVAAAAGVPVVAEGFADRAYAADGTLVPRDQPGAVLTDPAEVAARAVELATGRAVRSLCLHSDTPGAVDLARAVRSALDAAGVSVRAFR